MNSESEGRASIPTTLGGPACPVCDAAVESSIDLQDYQLFGCHKCGCWSSDALFREAETTFVPDSYFSNADSDRSKWEDLFTRIDGSEIRSVLDIGCGTGAFLDFVRGRYPEVGRVGVELDSNRADQAREADPAALIVTGDVEASALQLDEKFDLITMWDVFEHLPEPASDLEILASKLSSRGHLFLQTIHERSIVPTLGRLSYHLSGGRFDFLARRTHEAHHLVFFTHAGIELMANRAGLRVRASWHDYLALARMDGNRLLTGATAMLLAIENALGNGLFVNVILDKQAIDDSNSTREDR